MPVSPKRGAWARWRGRDFDPRGQAAPGAVAVLSSDPSAFYVCYVWRDRDVLGWLLGRKLVESFVTALNPDDPYSVQAVLAACVWRDAGPDADADRVLAYSIDVYDADGAEAGNQRVRDFRYSPYLMDRE